MSLFTEKAVVIPLSGQTENPDMPKTLSLDSDDIFNKKCREVSLRCITTLSQDAIINRPPIRI